MFKSNAWDKFRFGSIQYVVERYCVSSMFVIWFGAYYEEDSFNINMN